jgi:hypothetical protein
MNDALLAIKLTLQYTPWWVYLLLAYVIFIGIKASKSRTVSLRKLFILPVIFLALSLEMLVSHFDLNTLSICTWLGSVLLGSLIGALLVVRQPITVDRDKKALHLGGSWSTMILIFIIFSGKYYCGYALSADPGAVINTHTEIAVLAISGACSGTFLGRMLYYIFCYVRKKEA